MFNANNRFDEQYIDTPIYRRYNGYDVSFSIRIIQEDFQPKIGREIRIFSLGRKNNILIKKERGKRVNSQVLFISSDTPK